MTKRILRWLPVAIMMVLIFIASSTPGNELPTFGNIDLFVKKGGHLIGYALLAMACFMAVYNDTKSVTRSAVISLGLSIVYAALDEYHQSFRPDRHPSIIDVGIDAAGAIIGVCIAAFITKVRSG